MAAHASSRLFSGRNVDRTRESGGNRAYDLVPLRVLVCQRDEVTKLITIVGHSFQNCDSVYAGSTAAYTCLPTLRMGFKPIYNPPINFRVILLASLRHVVQIAGQLSRNNPRPRR